MNESIGLLHTQHLIIPHRLKTLTVQNGSKMSIVHPHCTDCIFQLPLPQLFTTKTQQTTSLI